MKLYILNRQSTCKQSALYTSFQSHCSLNLFLRTDISYKRKGPFKITFLQLLFSHASQNNNISPCNVLELLSLQCFFYFSAIDEPHDPRIKPHEKSTSSAMKRSQNKTYFSHVINKEKAICERQILFSPRLFSHLLICAAVSRFACFPGCFGFFAAGHAAPVEFWTRDCLSRAERRDWLSRVSRRPLTAQ